MAKTRPWYHLPEPQRAAIAGSLAWIDHRLLRGGYLAVMTHAEQSLYLFLALAAGHQGHAGRVAGVHGSTRLRAGRAAHCPFLRSSSWTTVAWKILRLYT